MSHLKQEFPPTKRGGKSSSASSASLRSAYSPTSTSMESFRSLNASNKRAEKWGREGHEWSRKEKGLAQDEKKANNSQKSLTYAMKAAESQLLIRFFEDLIVCWSFLKASEMWWLLERSACAVCRLSL